MGMPNHLVLVRHGESEANVVHNSDKKGKLHEQHEIINDRPDWQQRLSPRGVEQAKQAGEWIRRSLGGVATFDVRYCSMFLRARETAAYITGDEDCLWTPDDRIVERSWGKFGAVSMEERERLFADTARMYQQSPFYQKLDGGESRFDVIYRWRDFQDTLHRDWDSKKVLIVTHGDLIGVARYALERMLPEQFEDMENDSTQTIKNCAAIEYSKHNPHDPDDVRNKLTWLRITNTTSPETSPFDGEWVQIPPRPRFTAAELLTQVERAPRLLSADAVPEKE